MTQDRARRCSETGTLFDTPKPGSISGLRWMIGESTPAIGLPLSSPAAAARYMTWQASRNREIMTVLLLNSKNGVIDHFTVSVGAVDSAGVDPREVFRPAIAKSAASIILVHNHPSGNPEPSNADKDLTRTLVLGGSVLYIKVLDHIILGAPTPADPAPYWSFAENGRIDDYESQARVAR